MRISRLKSTGEIVHVIGAADNGHVYCLFPYKGISKKGDRGSVQVVRKDKLTEEGTDYLSIEVKKSG